MPGSGGGQTASTSQNQNTSFNQTSSASPWGPFNDFLTGGAPGANGQPGTPGILPNLAAAFNNSAWSPAMSNATNNYFNDVTRRQAIFGGGGFENTGAAMNQGAYDAHITPAGNVTPMMVDPTNARGNMGELDPTGALKTFLNGSNVNPWIDQQQRSITNQLTRNTLENVMPNIRSGAIEAGQYGGNRQGLAEGTAISRLNTDLAPTLAGLASNAFENQQNRGLSTAQGLEADALNVANANANRKLTADTTNVGTSLANNAQSMQNSDQTVRNRLNALNYTANANTLDNQNYSDLMNSIMAPSNYNWQNLGRFASVLQPMLPLYQTNNASGTGTMQSYGTQVVPGSGGSPFGMGLGGLLSLGSLAGQLGWQPFAAGAGAAGAAGGLGSAGTAGLMALAASDVRLKENIAPVGKTNDGQNIYSYRYKGDPTPRMGLMAQEVEQIKPEAVVTHPSGFKMVNYDLALGDSIFLPKRAA